ncbi:MAG TPA: tetratricopeptide repeat protein [Flavipsychrobacter sp.]|nr:tetratricopeptide repeat protein [Flavipsychrobacter sp.]
MRALALLVCLLLSSVAMHAADNYGAYWQKANAAYKQKNYDSAAHYYEQIASAKPADYEVYYNLGNTYYKLNRIGDAVLNYQRGLQLNPSDKNIQDNLLLAQSRIAGRIVEIEDIFFVRWWKSLTAASAANTWATVTLILFLLLIGYAILNRLGKAPFSLPFQAKAGGWVLLVLFITISFVAAMHKADSHMAVVMNNSQMMDKPPMGKSQPVPEGTTIKLTGEITKGEWHEVILPDGKTGWMHKTDFVEI